MRFSSSFVNELRSHSVFEFVNLKIFYLGIDIEYTWLYTYIKWQAIEQGHKNAGKDTKWLTEIGNGRQKTNTTRFRK